MRSLEGIVAASADELPSDAMKDALEDKELGRKFDGDKPDWSLLDLNILEDTVKVLTFGAKKYDRDNWQQVKNGEQRYYAALIRHLNAHRSGEKLDPESGLPHLAHAMCCLTFLSYLDQNA